MYYLKNNLNQIIEELIVVDGREQLVMLFACETIYNIDSKSVKLMSDSKLTLGYHSEKIYSTQMKMYFMRKQIIKLGDNFGYRLVCSNENKKLIIVLGEMSLQGHNTNLQYIYTPFNKFIENEFKDQCIILSLIDTNSIFGNYCNFSDNDLKLFLNLITSLLNKYNLGYDDVYIVGSSIGASCAIILSQYFKNSHIISSMPLLNINSYCFDNITRKAMYFINGKYLNDITPYISSVNNYYVYMGAYDLTAHNNYHYKILDKSNVCLNIVNDWHTATKHFKYDILYQIDSSFRTYTQTNLHTTIITNISTKNILEVYFSFSNPNEHTYAIYVITINDYHLNYKATYDYNNKQYYIDGGINLLEYTRSVDNICHITCNISIIDYANKINYLGKLVTISHKNNIIQSLSKQMHDIIKPSFFSHINNMLMIEFTLHQKNVPLIARIVDQNTNLLCPLQIKKYTNVVSLQLNNRRSIFYKDSLSNLKLQLLYADGSEQIFEIEYLK